MNIVMTDNPAICLTQSIKICDITDLHTKLDDITWRKGEMCVCVLLIKNVVYKAIYPNCQGRVIGKIDSTGMVAINDHSYDSSAYRMNKECELMISSSIVNGATIISKNIHKNDYYEPKSTLYRLLEKGSSAAKIEIDWPKFYSYINHISIENKNNTLFHTIKDGKE